MKIAILILLVFSRFAAADNFLETIQLPGNECFSSATGLKSGDLMATGADFASDDILVFKFSDSGSVQRAQRIAGSGSDQAQAIVGTSDGGAVVVGNTNSFGVGLLDGFILKVQSSGAVLCINHCRW
ncbi:hypothetical protein L0244_16760 [bacterium]|nr:hypothetical protein [bacterium]MCI0614641.1 hypothetical protein [bacterium]